MTKNRYAKMPGWKGKQAAVKRTFEKKVAQGPPPDLKRAYQAGYADGLEAYQSVGWAYTVLYGAVERAARITVQVAHVKLKGYKEASLPELRAARTNLYEAFGELRAVLKGEVPEPLGQAVNELHEAMQELLDGTYNPERLEQSALIAIRDQDEYAARLADLPLGGRPPLHLQSDKYQIWAGEQYNRMAQDGKNFDEMCTELRQLITHLPDDWINEIKRQVLDKQYTAKRKSGLDTLRRWGKKAQETRAT